MRGTTRKLTCVVAVVFCVSGPAAGAGGVNEPDSKPLDRRSGKVLVLTSVDMLRNDFFSFGGQPLTIGDVLGAQLPFGTTSFLFNANS